MQPIADALRACSDGRFAVDVVEFPGHGDTLAGDSSLFRMAHFVDVMASRVAMCESPPVLFGYSMGGYVGLALEARLPGSFAAIATLGTKFLWDVATAEREAARLDAAVIAAKVPRFAETLAARHAGAGGWETVVARTAALLRHNGVDPLLTPELLSRIGIPVTVAVGSRDDTVSVEESTSCAARMPRGRCEVLDQVPHPIERVPTDSIVSLVEELMRAS